MPPLINLLKSNEKHHYSGMAVRVSKRSHQPVRDGFRQQNPLYLLGLEIRTKHSGKNITEQLFTVSINGVRLLYWQTGKPEGISRIQTRYSSCNHIDSCTLELDNAAKVISQEIYYPFGGTAIWGARNL